MHLFCSLRLLTLPIDTDELKIAKAAHQNCVPASTLETRLKEREEAHQVELKNERDEISRLKLELQKSQNEKAELETALAEEKRLRVEETRELRENLNETEQRANSVEKQIDVLKAKPEQWLRELVWINRELAGKFLLSCVFISMSRPT